MRWIWAFLLPRRKFSRRGPVNNRSEFWKYSDCSGILWDAEGGYVSSQQPVPLTLECLLPLASRDFIMPTTHSGCLGALGFDEYITNTANLKKNNYFKQQSPASVLDFASIIYSFSASH